MMTAYLPPPDRSSIPQDTRKAPDRGLLHQDQIPFSPSHAPRFNRALYVLIHVPWYGFDGQQRLAADAGVAGSTISRILKGINIPRLVVQQNIADAFSRRLGLPIPAREVFSPDGTYPTLSCCQLCGCTGCFPPWAYNEDTDEPLPEWEYATPGVWSLGTSPTKSQSIWPLRATLHSKLVSVRRPEGAVRPEKEVV